MLGKQALDVVDPRSAFGGGPLHLPLPLCDGLAQSVSGPPLGCAPPGGGHVGDVMERTICGGG
jgi:hypothetical protein